MGQVMKTVLMDEKEGAIGQMACFLIRCLANHQNPPYAYEYVQESKIHDEEEINEPNYPASS